MKMRIKNLFFLHLLLIFSIAGLAIYSGLKYQAFSVLEQAEKETLKTENRLIIRTIQNEIDRIVTLAKDWGARDKTYIFMQNGNLDFIRENLSQNYLNDVEIDGILFLDRNFSSYFSYPNIKKETQTEFHEIVSQVQSKKDLFTDSLRQGVHRILLFNPEAKLNFWAAIHPISLAGQPDYVDGYLLLIKLIDRTFVQKISRIIGKPLKLKASENISGFECLLEESFGEFCEKVYFLNDSKALLDISILDSDQKKRIFFHTEIKRSLDQKIRQVFRHTLLIISATGLLVILVNVLMVHRVVVRPTLYLAERFSTFAQQRTVHQRLKVKGAYEIREMTRAANLMLNEIENLNEQLTVQSRTDELTELFNRRYFGELLQRELGRAAREKTPLALLMLDIDHFKQYNDHYGHVAGDKCLKRVATILKQTLRRSNDIVARFGGEEFILLLSNTNLSQLEQLVNNLGNRLKEAALPHNYSQVATYVTCSIGGVSIVPTPETTERTLILRADALLYQAKENGRNRAVLSDSLGA